MGAGKVIGKALKESNALLDEFLESIKSAGKTPIVPAPNRWFAKPEEFPHVQPMVERALTASGKTRDDFLHGAYLDPRTGQDLTGRMMDEVGVLIDPRTGRPMMSGRESGMEEFAELEKRLGNQTLSNLVRRSKFKPTGGDTLLNDIPFIATVEQGPHYYGLGTEYASPTQLFQVQTGSNPHLRPKSRGDVFGMGEVVGRMQIGQGPEHDVYEKLFVAPRGSDVPGKKLSKKKGGEVKMGVGGTVKKGAELVDTFLKELNKPAKAAAKAAPQDEALRLAQQRAALPPAQGGLGLPANNTPMERANAMGFVKDTYHGGLRNVKKLDPRKGSTESHAGQGVYSTDSPADASENYGSIYGPDVEGKIDRSLDEQERQLSQAMRDRRFNQTLTPRQQSALLNATIGADNLGVVYPLKVRADKPIHLDLREDNPVMIGPVYRFDENTRRYEDTPHTETFEKAIRELDQRGSESNKIRDFIYDLSDENGIAARRVFNSIKSLGDSEPLYDPYTGNIISGGVAAADFVKHFGVDEINHLPQFRNPQLNIGTEHTISLNPDNVRSRFAAFDPWRKDAATAAAFGVAAPDLLAKEEEKAMGGDVHMMGGGRPPKKTTLEEDLKSFKDPAMALADMLAGAARGTTATATGFYGDIEDLVRKYGKGLPANVIRSLLPTREGKETLLPTVEEMNVMLPPVVPKGASRSAQVADVYNDLGMANPAAPTAGAAVVKGVKAAAPYVARGALDLARSDAAYNLANKVADVTGVRKQIMIGPKAKTYRHDDAALAAQMEKDGRSRADIWQATRTVRTPDNQLKQELSDLNMKYSVSPVRSRQYETDRKRYSQAIDKATTDDELLAAQKYYEKQRKNNSLNFTGKAQEFIEHPELFAAYPELANYAFRELEPTHNKFTAPQTAYGFFSPGQQTVTVNTDAPFKRSTALHELQHAIQEIEGWQGGSSPEEMAARLADRDIAKTREADLQKLIQEMQLTLPASQNNLILTEGQKLKNIQDFLNKTKQLEGETDPYDAYRKVSGEEEARMVQARRDYPEEKLAERPPFMDYEAKPWEHITDFADGGAVMMGAGGTVKKGIELVDTFLNALKEGEKPATAANRVAAGNKAAAMIKKDPPIKASEALGQQMEQGFKKVSTTQSDRTRVGKGNIGGAAFPALSRVDPRYAGKVWGVMDANTAKRLTNLTSPDTLWTTMLGSADQLKTNPVVFDSLESQFREAMAAGLLKPDLEGKINQNLKLFLGEGADIRDPEIWKALDTFEKRASMANIMMGKGEPPSKGGVPLGGEKSGKGVIFNPSETLIDETEMGLLHPEHGGYVPTYALGPRLFTLDGGTTYRPDLHPGFPTLLTGEDRGVNMIPTPTEVFLPDWHQHFKNTVAKQNAEKVLEGKKPRTAPAGYYDLALGLKGEGLPSQELTDDYIRHLIREGYAEGGAVDMAAGGVAKKALEKATPIVDNAIKDAVESLRGYVDPIATKISEWNWRPMTDVRQEVPNTEVPEYIQKGYGDFMAEQAKRAAAGDLNARDLIKAYTITRSSVNRGGLGYNTATKTGMQLPPTQGLVRPEGAFAEWLGSKAGQRYLDQAEKGTFTESDLDDMMTRFAPFGMPAVLADDMRYAARSLSPRGATISADVMASPEVYREVSQQLKGIGPAKSGFMASLLGRGDYPTFDARQIRLHTGQGGKDAAKYMTRGKGVGGEEAVARLADRQRAMNMSLDPSLDPFYQHLVHHTVWDKIGNEKTTHDDLVKAMRGYADGGEVDSDGVTLDEFLKNQGY